MITYNLTLEDMPSRNKKLANIAKVENFKSSKSGQPIANQFIITLQNGIEVFQSYNSIIAVKANNETYLDQNRWNYSKTTSRYRNQFLNETTVETVKKIGLGTYAMADLNNTFVMGNGQKYQQDLNK
jgi:hypothetical protein